MKCDKCQVSVSIQDTQPIRTIAGTRHVCDDCVEDFMACDLLGTAGDFNKNLRGMEWGIRVPHITLNGNPIPHFVVNEVTIEPRHSLYHISSSGYYDYMGHGPNPMRMENVARASILVDCEKVKI